MAGMFLLPGSIVTDPSIDNALDCIVEFEDVKLDDSLITCLPDAIEISCRKVNPRGIVSGRAVVNKIFENGIKSFYDNDTGISGISHDVTLHLKDGDVQYEELPVVISEVDARLKIVNERVTIESFNGLSLSDGMGAAVVSGMTSNSIGKDSIVAISGDIWKGGYDLDIDCKAMELSEPIKNYVDNIQSGIWSKYSPQGSADFDITVEKDENGSQDYSCAIVPVKMSCTFSDYKLDSLGGKIVIEPDRIEFVDFSSANDMLVVDGIVKSADQLKEYDLNIKTSDLDIDTDFRKSFIQYSGLLNDSLALTGKLSSDLDLSYRDMPGQDSILTVGGKGSFNKGSSLLPLETTEIDTKFEFDMELNRSSSQLKVDASVSDFNALLMGRPINKAFADIKYNNNDKKLSVMVDSSLFCNGRTRRADQCRIGRQ